MNAIDLLTLITELFFILLGIVTAIEYVRNWDRTRRDVMLMVWALSGLFLIQLLVKISAQPTPRWAGVIGLFGLVSQPYLMLRLVRYLRPVPKRLMQIGAIGMVAFWAVVLFWTPTPAFVTLILIGYFVLIDGYAMVALVRGARQTSGVASHRLRFAAAGAGLLAGVLVLLTLAAIVPFLIAPITLAVYVGLISSGITFYIGFAPPRWLRRSWQFAEVNQYLINASSKSTAVRADFAAGMLELCQAATKAVGGMAAGILQRDEADQKWLLKYQVGMPADLVLDEEGALAQAWRGNIATAAYLVENPSATDRNLLKTVGAETLLVVPIITRDHVWGMLLIFLRYGSLFVDDDLSLAMVLANQSAVTLENSSLLEQMRAYSQGLESAVEQSTEALIESEDRYRKMLDNMLEGCQILTFDWVYEYVNEAAAQYGHVSKADLEGHSLLEIYPGIEASPMFAAMKKCMDERTTQVQEFEFFFPDGRVSWFEFSIQPVPEGIFILSLDITERKKQQALLVNANEELERRVAERTKQLEYTNKELEAFSYSVSHDLRSPLRAIDGFSMALEEDYHDQLDDTGRSYLSRIRNGSQRMGQLIDDLLELSRLSRSDMRQERVDLSALAHRIEGELREQFQERQVEFKIEEGINVTGDSRLLRIALTNLINNAWKYTGKQEKACVEFGAAEKDGSRVYYVRDNGAGFDMTYADKLFGVFQRLHSMNEFPGNGVGLATVQRIIHRHGGTVWAEGVIGKGATFYFSFGEPVSASNAA